MSDPSPPDDQHLSDQPTPPRQDPEPPGATDHQSPLGEDAAARPEQEPGPPSDVEREPANDAPWLSDRPSADVTEEFDLPITVAPRPQPRPARRWPGAVRALLFFTAAFIVSQIGQLIGLALALVILLLTGRVRTSNLGRMPAAMDWLTGQPLVIFALGFFGLLAALIVTLAFTDGWDRRPLASVGFQVDAAAARQFAAGLALGAVLIGAIFAAEWALGWLRVTRVAPWPYLLAHTALWLVVLLPAAATEEVLLRGYSFQALEEQWGGKAATLITAVVFGLLHAGNPNANWSAIGGIALSGILFGVAVLVTRRLWLPIGLHASWNLFEGPVLGFPVSGMDLPSAVTTVVSGPTLWTGGRFGPEAGLLDLFASLLGIALLVVFRRRTPDTRLQTSHQA
jgi:membrane protease YdiL (CAAX protease family)